MRENPMRCISEKDNGMYEAIIWDKCGSVVGNYKLSGDFHLRQAA